MVKDILEKKDKRCEFEYEGWKCNDTNVVGISRCKYLCKIHFTTIVNDNTRKFNKGEKITEDMVFTRKLLYSETKSILGDKSNYPVKHKGL